MKKSIIFFITSAFCMHSFCMENPDHAQGPIVRAEIVDDGPIVLTINNQTNKEYNIAGGELDHIIRSGQTTFSGLELQMLKGSFGIIKNYHISPLERMPTGQMARIPFAAEMIEMTASCGIDNYPTTRYLIKASITNYYIRLNTSSKRAELPLLTAKTPYHIHVLLAGENLENSDIAVSAEIHKAKIK